jgi:hypothetical protein
MMSIRAVLLRIVGLAALTASAGVLAGGCSGIMDSVSGRYRGPQPLAESLSGETVVIRRVTVLPAGSAFIVDRARFVEAGDPHNINRVVEVVTTEATRNQVSGLNLRAGDRVILSTQFQSITTQVGALGIPDWPGPGRYEYPIGFHSFSSVARVGS